MLLGFDKYSTTVRVQIVFPTSQEYLPDTRDEVDRGRLATADGPLVR